MSDFLAYPQTARQLTSTATSQSVELTAGIRAISMLAVGQAARYVLASAAPTASATASHYIAAGERLDLRIPPGGRAHLGYIRDTAAAANGQIEITELT